MRCPGCSNLLTQYDMNGIVLDVCTEHCGGIWFDAGEFERFDEAREEAHVDILRPVRNADVAIDRSQPRPCPRCEDTTLTKRFFDPAREIEIDQCAKCHGIFLDPGELQQIREDNRGSEERKRVMEEFIKKSAASNEKADRGLRSVLSLLFK